MRWIRAAAVVCILAGGNLGAAQEQPARRYIVGLTTTFSLQTIELRRIDASLPNLSGGHASGLFFHVAAEPWLHLGAETYVSSFEDGRTDLLLQAAGVSALVRGVARVYPFANLLAGGMLLDVGTDGGASGSVHRRRQGVILAPGIGLGWDLGPAHLRATLRAPLHLGVSSSGFGGGGVSALNQFYAGASVALAL